MHTGGGGKKRVLVVDDELINLLTIRAVLGERYDVFTAASAEEGLRILEKTSVSAVVSDQRMPGMKGTELFSILDDRRVTGARFILSGYTDDEEIRIAMENGIIDAALDKPLNTRELVDYIEKSFVLD